MNKKSTLKKTLVAFMLSGLSFFSFSQVYYTNDFSNAADWTMSNDAGNTDDWVISTTGPSGGFSIGPILSTSAANGFALFDSDLLCSGSQMAYIVNANPIDLSANSMVNLKFESFYRKWTGQVFVLVSTDLTNWTPFEQYPTFVDNDFSPNPDLVSINISSAIVGDPSNVYIMFYYLSDAATNGGDGCDYSWMIDDVSIEAIPATVDLSLTLDAINEYTIKPNPQGNADLVFNANISNVSGLDVASYDVITNVYLDPDYTTPVQTFTNNATNLTVGNTTTINQGTFTTTGVGTYVTETYVAAPGDVNTANDTVYSYIIMDDYEYARDLGNLNGTAIGTNGGTNELILGQTFEITTTAVMDSVLFVVAPGIAGGTISAQISAVTAGVPSNTFIGQSADITIDQALVDFVGTNGYAVLIPAVTDISGNPLSLTPGTYFVGVKQNVGTENMGLQYSDGIITSGSQFYSLDGAAFDDLVNAGFTQTAIIRPYLSSSVAPTITSNDVDNQICDGETIMLTSSEAAGNQWNMNGNPIPGETNATLNVMASGDYSVTVNGLTSNVISVMVNALPTVDAGADMAICMGANATLMATGALTYTWDNGLPNGGTFSPAATATYNVVGMDANGCSGSDAVTITVNALPIISLGTITQPSACATADGSIQVNGTDTGDLMWTGTASGSMVGVTLPQTIMNLGAGTYMASLVDVNGCMSNTITGTLSDPGVTAPVISADGPTTFCMGGSVNLTCDVAAGITWSNGATDQTINVTNSGSYSVTLVNGACTATSNSIDVIVNPIPSISLASSANPTTCSGSDGMVMVNTSANGTISWAGAATGNMAVSSSPSIISNLTAGTYTISFVSNSGCPATSFDVSLSDPNVTVPTITASGSTTFCMGGSVVLTSSSLTNNMWSTGETTQSISVTSSGMYSVAVTSAGCVGTSGSTSVVVNPTPSISQGAVTAPSVCAATDATIEVTGTDTGDLMWSGAASGSMMGVTLPQTIMNLGTGSYMISLMDANGCTSNSISVSISDPGVTAPVISADGATTFCMGGSVNLTSDVAAGITWTNGAGTNQTINVTNSGSYSVTMVSGGCTATSNTIDVVVNPTPAISVASSTNPTTCSGMDGMVMVNASSNGMLSWTNGTVNGSSNVVISPTTVTGLGAGTYTFSFTSTDGCDASTVDASLSDPNVTVPTISADGPTAFCVGGSVTLTSSTGDTYLWSDGSMGASITVMAGGDYSVTTVVNGCTASSVATTVVVNSLPTVDAGSDMNICSGSTATLSGSGAVTYVWNNGVTDGVAFTPTATATYTVTGTDANNCSNTDQVVVTIMTSTVSAGNDVAVCEGGSVTLAGANGSGFTWNNGITDGVAFTATATTTYTVTGTGTNGCTGSDNVTVTVNALPTVDAGADVSVCMGLNVTLMGSGAVTYTWDNGVVDGVAFNAPADTTVYTVTGTDGNNCSSTDMVTVNPVDCAGIDENSNVLLNVYPNPTNGMLTISSDDFKGFTSILVKDQVGRNVINSVEISSNVMNVDLSALANGTYFVVLTGNNSNKVIQVQLTK